MKSEAFSDNYEYRPLKLLILLAFFGSIIEQHLEDWDLIQDTSLKFFYKKYKFIRGKCEAIICIIICGAVI